MAAHPTLHLLTALVLVAAGRNGVDTVVLVVKYAAIATLLVLSAGLLYVVYVFGSLIFLTCNDCTVFNVVQLLLYGLANATIALNQSVGVFGDISWLYGITEDWVKG